MTVDNEGTYLQGAISRTVDRERIRRDAAEWPDEPVMQEKLALLAELEQAKQENDFLTRCLADPEREMLARLEQAERERDEARDELRAVGAMLDDCQHADRAAEARAEQAERERDTAREEADALDNRLDALTFRLAAADTLAEAVKEIATCGIAGMHLGDSKWWDGGRCSEAARAALAAYQRERGE